MPAIEHQLRDPITIADAGAYLRARGQMSLYPEKTFSSQTPPWMQWKPPSTIALLRGELNRIE